MNCLYEFRAMATQSKSATPKSANSFTLGGRQI